MLSLLYIVQRSIPATTLFPYTTLFRSRERAVRLGPDARRREQLELLRHAAARRQRRLHPRQRLRRRRRGVRATERRQQSRERRRSAAPAGRNRPYCALKRWLFPVFVRNLVRRRTRSSIG